MIGFVISCEKISEISQGCSKTVRLASGQVLQHSSGDYVMYTPKRSTTPHTNSANTSNDRPQRRRQSASLPNLAMPVSQHVPSENFVNSLLTDRIKTSPTSPSARSKSSPKRKSRIAQSHNGSVSALAIPSGTYLTPQHTHSWPARSSASVMRLPGHLQGLWWGWRLTLGGLQIQRKAKTLAQDENRYLDHKWGGAWDVAEEQKMLMA